MRINRKFIGVISGTFLIALSHLSNAGIGNNNNPNPVGGFGQTYKKSASDPNPTGGFGTLAGSDPMPLGPPPPPPEPVPLDGGAGLLIAAALGLGIKKLYGEVKRK